MPTTTPTTTAPEPDQEAERSEPSVSTTVPPEPVDLRTGSFVSLDHTTSGTVRVLELADGRRFVRLERFETDNGPDLYLYLSTNPADGPEGAFDDQFANLGGLQGNIGDQNYELPSDVDPARYTSVVIWCDRFDAASAPPTSLRRRDRPFDPDTTGPTVPRRRSPMSPSPTDRRVRRTRELLRNAFLSLIAEKGYDRITVQDILDRADVGRSTFYAHYRDKEDLLRAGFDDIRAALAAERNASEAEPEPGADVELLQPLLIVFTHVERHRQLWAPMSRKGGTELITRLLRKGVDDLVREHLQSHFGASGVDPTELEAAVQFVAGACMGLLVWWLDHDDIPSSAEEVHTIFRRLATPGIERFLAA